MSERLSLPEMLGRPAVLLQDRSPARAGEERRESGTTPLTKPPQQIRCRAQN